MINLIYIFFNLKKNLFIKNNGIRLFVIHCIFYVIAFMTLMNFSNRIIHEQKFEQNLILEIFLLYIILYEQLRYFLAHKQIISQRFFYNIRLFPVSRFKKGLLLTLADFLNAGIVLHLIGFFYVSIQLELFRNLLHSLLVLLLFICFLFIVRSFINLIFWFLGNVIKLLGVLRLIPAFVVLIIIALVSLKWFVGIQTHILIIELPAVYPLIHNIRDMFLFVHIDRIILLFSVMIFIVLLNFIKLNTDYKGSFSLNSSHLPSIGTLSSGGLFLTMVKKEFKHIAKNKIYRYLLIFIALQYTWTIYQLYNHPKSLKMSIFMCILSASIWIFSLWFVWGGEKGAIRQYFILPIEFKHFILAKDLVIYTIGFILSGMMAFSLSLMKIKFYKEISLNLVLGSQLLLILYLFFKNLFLPAIIDGVELNTDVTQLFRPGKLNYRIFILFFYFGFIIVYIFIFPVASIKRGVIWLILIILLSLGYMFSLKILSHRMYVEKDDFIYAVTNTE